MQRVIAVSVGIVAVLSGSTASQAQERPYNIAVNVAAAAVGILSFDLERAVTAHLSLGGTATFGPVKESVEPGFVANSYLSMDTKLRFYLQGRSPRGLSIGGNVGFVRSFAGAAVPPATAEDGIAFSTGLQLEHNWFPRAADGRLLLGAGAGVKRLWGLDREPDDGAPVYPTVRLAIGYSF